MSGVPQGTVLRPLLFLIFINHLPEQLHSKVRLFADDCIVYTEPNSQADCDARKDFPKLSLFTFCTGAMITLSGSNYPCLERISMVPKMFEPLRFDCNMLGFLRRNLRISSQDTKTLAYIALMRSNLEYCATVWNPYMKEQIYKLEMIQRPAARFVMNRFRNTSSVSDMLDQLHWETLEARRTKMHIVNNLVDVHKNLYLTPGIYQDKKETFKEIPVFPNLS